MAKSSIHIQRAVRGSVGHNSRENFSYSVVFSDEKNECDANKQIAYKNYRVQLKVRSAKYTNRTKQKLQKNTVTQLSAVINLEQHHILKDLEPLKTELEKKFDTKVYQMAIHRDEGKLVSKEDETELYSGKDFFLNTKDNQLYFDKKFTKLIPIEKYEVVKNYHAHIEMIGLDSNGQAIRQKMNKVVLQQLQTFAANNLKMERGKATKSYTKEQIKEIINIVGKKTDYASTTLYAQKFNEIAKELGYYHEKKKRQDTHEFKDSGVEREGAKRNQLAKAKDIKAENTLLRVELKKIEAVRDDYARLEKFNKDLKERLKSKELTVEELKQEVQKYKDKYISKKVDYEFLQDDLDSSKKVVNEIKSKNKALEEELVKKDEKINFRANESDLKVFAEQELNQDFTSWSFTKLFNGLVSSLKKAWNEIKELKNKVLELEKNNGLLNNENKKLREDRHKGVMDDLDKVTQENKKNQVDEWWDKKMEEHTASKTFRQR